MKKQKAGAKQLLEPSSTEKLPQKPLLKGRKKIRFFYSLTKEFLKRRYRIVVVGFIIGTIFFYISPRVLQKFPIFSKPTKIGVVGKFTVDEIPMDIQLKISRGLTMTKENGEVGAALATSWKIEDGGKKYVFELNKELKWSDGRKFVAKDINYNFEDVVMSVDNDYQVSFALKLPFTPFPIAVSKPIFRKGFVGMGEYRVERFEFNGKFVKAIFIKSTSLKGVRDIAYKFYPTEESAKTAIKLGEITNLENILDPEGLIDYPTLKLNSKIRDDRFTGLFFNTEKPFIEDKLFRQALAYAINKDFKKRAYGPISPSSWAYFEDVKPYNYDVKRAKTLLENSLGELNPEEVKLTIMTVPQLLSEAEKIRNNWQELGIEVEIAPFKSGETDFQVLLAIQEIPIDPDQYSLWHSTSQNNITRLKSPRIDKLLEEGRVTQDQNERKMIYFDFQKYIVEEVPVAFLYYPEVFEVARK